MLVIGLTGSIGMGKSTTAKMFADAGCAVYDADAAVRELYAGEAAPLIEAAFPGTVVDGTVDRKRLSERVVGDPDAFRRLEEIVHPLVRAAESRFVADAEAKGAEFAVLDIPLLLERVGRDRMDAVVVVTAPAEVQRQRVLARPGMTEETFEKILARQMPDAEKRKHADFLVDTSKGFEAAHAQVIDILDQLRIRARQD